MKKTFIFGHQKPDTDSITSAIAFSYLKNQLGENTEPRALGSLNKESLFALDYFNIKEPKRLDSVRLQVKDVHYLKNHFINRHFSILDTFNYMMNNLITTLPVIDTKTKKLLGIVSMKDIARDQISGNINTLNTSYDNILVAINGEEILRFDEEIKGNIKIASYSKATILNDVKLDHETILLMGNRYNVLEHAIDQKILCIIMTGNEPISEELLKKAKKNKINLIRTEADTFLSSKHIGLSNYISTILNNKDVVSFHEDDTLDYVKRTASEVKYSNYPIINDEEECLGVLRLGDMDDVERKQCILVDHNEYEQSVDGLNQADIVEIIDHHKIGSIGTNAPINFRNMPLGSTNTILYLMYKEHHIDIPKSIAGIMLSGILSDTLILKSPTSTKMDEEAIKVLSKIAEVDYEEYGMKMFKAASSLEGMTKEQVLYSDFKNFHMNDFVVGIGQVLTLDIDQIKQVEEEYIALLDQEAENKGYDVVGLFITDIINQGSYIYFNHSSKDIWRKSFHMNDLEEGTFIEGCISRKKQMVPAIMKVLDK